MQQCLIILMMTQSCNFISGKTAYKKLSLQYVIYVAVRHFDITELRPTQQTGHHFSAFTADRTQFFIVCTADRTPFYFQCLHSNQDTFQGLHSSQETVLGPTQQLGHFQSVHSRQDTILGSTQQTYPFFRAYTTDRIIVQCLHCNQTQFQGLQKSQTSFSDRAQQ